MTSIFTTYVLGLIPSLLFFGRLSDHVGRRPLLVAGMMLASAGSLLFAFAEGTVWLFVARAVQGVAVGMASGTGRPSPSCNRKGTASEPLSRGHRHRRGRRSGGAARGGGPGAVCSPATDAAVPDSDRTPWCCTPGSLGNVGAVGGPALWWMADPAP
ncbi:MAG: hypothetical protein DLM70_14500 [Chloroflexi bacterium]|nr:MAG: hypothetical protein DLM70_14500 [Chloroflexota bacterium]